MVSGSGYRGDSWGVGRIEEAVKRAPRVDHAQHVKQGTLGESTAGDDDIFCENSGSAGEMGSTPLIFFSTCSNISISAEFIFAESFVSAYCKTLTISHVYLMHIYETI